MEIRLNRAEIRDWRTGDEDPLAVHANNVNVWRNLRDSFPHPYTREHARNWIESASASHNPTHFAIVVAGAAAGGIGYTLKHDICRRSAEVGYWLGEAFWGRGIVTEALMAISEYAFARHDLCRLYALVFEWNPASMRVLEKAGYEREARLKRGITKDGHTIDGFLYARLRS